MGSVDQYKRGAYFSKEFVEGTITGTTNWNGFEHNLLFERVAEKKFADVARPRGCDAIEDSRGVAIADLNRDGLLDIVINNNNAAPTIYLNLVKDAGNWTQLELRGGSAGNPDAIGARVKLQIVTDSGATQTLMRWVEAGSGYAAQSDMRVHFGLGTATQITSLDIRWPDGETQHFNGEALGGLLNQRARIEQGVNTFVRPDITTVTRTTRGD